MSLTKRVAAIATVTFGLFGLVSASTPGFAAQIDRTINAGATMSVPQPGMIPAVATTQTQPLMIQPLPGVSNSAQPNTVQPLPAENGSANSAERYDSLAAAVAAQRDVAAVGDDLTCLAGAVYHESKGEPLSGQLAVAEVIINRTKSGRFPKSICSVVTQPGQFSFVRGGRVPAVANNAAYRTALAVARVAIDDRWDSPAADAMYFHARRVSPGWHRVQVAAIGNQVFYR